MTVAEEMTVTQE